MWFGFFFFFFQAEDGIRDTACGLLQGCAVADGLAQFGELSLEPPAERAEPEQRGINPREHLQVEVTLPDMRAFVRKNYAQLLRVPLVIVRGENDAGSDGDRGRNKL